MNICDGLCHLHLIFTWKCLQAGIVDHLSQDKDQDILVNALKLDSQRMRYLMVSYQRTRIKKIEKFAGEMSNGSSSSHIPISVVLLAHLCTRTPGYSTDRHLYGCA